MPEDLPAACYPGKVKPGGKNYTIRNIEDGVVTAVVQVHLEKEQFYVKRGRTPITESPTIIWKKHGGVRCAWEHVVAMVGGWLHDGCKMGGSID